MRIAKGLAVLSSLATFVGIASAATPTPAAPALPFQPPQNWQALPSAFIPHPIASWQNGLSSFTLSSVALAIPADSLEPVLKAQSASLGTVASSASVPVCGEPAVELVIDLKGAPQVLTEQVQVAGDQTYIIAYSRPVSEPSAPAIASTMAAFCGDKSIATLVPPNGWIVTDARLVGIWVGSTPTELVTLVSSKPQADTQKLARDAAQTAFKGADVTMLSNTSGILCGLPARFFTAKVTPSGSPTSLVTMEITQSVANAYTLLYSHPVTVPEDAAAIASLKTLCANQQPAS